MKSSLTLSNAIANGIVAGLAAFIGGVITFRLGMGWIWGALFGAVVAYFLRDPMELKHQAEEAYHRTINWRPNKRYWMAMWFTALALMAIMSSLLSMILVGAIVKSSSVSWMIVKVYPLFGVIIVGSLLASIIAVKMEPDVGHGMNNEWKWASKNLNPITIALYHVPRLIWRFIKMLWTALPPWREGIAWFHTHFVNAVEKGIAFIILFLILIHSRERVVCAIDTALGFGVGLWFGTEIACGIAGLLIGFLHEYFRTAIIVRFTPHATA